MTIRRLLAPCAALLSLVWLAAPVLAQSQPAQTEFVPLSQVPRTEQIPAAPFVFIAYAIVWLFVLFYVWTLWRRQGRVEKELQELQHRMGERSHTR
jgi:CcmD family protein